MAARAGGSYVDGQAPDAVDRIMAALQEVEWSGLDRHKRDRLDLFASWPFLAVVAILLGVEWFLRRRNGML